MKDQPLNPPETTNDPRDDLGVWGTVKLSLKGEELDYTTGPLGRAILLLSIPMVLEMAMESVFALTDAFFVSRLGTDAVATVGLTEAMVTILFAVAFGLSIGTTAMIARRIGEKDKAGARIAAAQAILLGLAVSAAFAVPGFIFGDRLLAAMGGSPELVASGHGFTRVIFGGCGTIVLLFLLNAVFRGAGDAAIAMRVLWIANAVNIVLDPCLIFGLGPFPEMGVTGAAVATTIGRGIGVAVQLYVLFFGGSRIRIALRHLAPRVRVMLRLFRLSVGGMLQTVISHSSWLVLVWIVGSFGAAAVAGYTIAIRLVIFALLPSWGLANAAATLVGQNLGAGKPDRAERSAWLAGIFNTVFLLAVAVVFVTAAGPMIRLFTTEAAVVAAGIACLRWVSYGYPFYAWGMVMVQGFNGAGDTYTPTVINLFCYWLFQLPLAWALAHSAGFNATGVFMAIMIAEAALAVVAILVFRRGNWKQRDV
ncbi:MAG: MATE family efflux transporter [Thermoanaerobaculales bacterium]|nr:MATE family efflux transporter [Thermoanaerobaculales bacterium]